MACCCIWTRFINPQQQQSLLECIEDGSVTLIASTTENPYFYIYNALLSRCTVFEFKSLQPTDIEQGIRNALTRLGEEDGGLVQMPEEACRYLADACGGDMRKALGCLEFAATAAAPDAEGNRLITLEMVKQVARRTAMRYDRAGDDHYDIVSAYQKSMRGSDPDAALHYLGRLLERGDLASACRRLMVLLRRTRPAYPQIMPIVKAAVDIANMVGAAEGASRWQTRWCWWQPAPNPTPPTWESTGLWRI